jgi:hypothetical protein
LGPAAVSIPSSHIQNTSPPAGTGHQSVSSLMGSTHTRWTCGAQAVCFMRLPGRGPDSWCTSQSGRGVDQGRVPGQLLPLPSRLQSCRGFCSCFTVCWFNRKFTGLSPYFLSNTCLCLLFPVGGGWFSSDLIMKWFQSGGEASVLPPSEACHWGGTNGWLWNLMLRGGSVIAGRVS